MTRVGFKTRCTTWRAISTGAYGQLAALGVVAQHLALGLLLLLCVHVQVRARVHVPRCQGRTKGLHSFTFQLDLSRV